MDNKPMKIFSPVRQAPWAQAVAGRLGVALDALEERVFEDGEHKTRFLQPVAGADCYVLQSLHGDADISVNDRFIRSLFLAATLHDHKAGRVTGVFPYLAYARKDRRTQPFDPVASRYLAQLIEVMQFDQVLAVDVHNPAAFENAFRIPVVNLEAAPVLAGALIAQHPTKPHWVVVSPDAGGYKRAERFREALADQTGQTPSIAFIEKKRRGGVLSGGQLVGDVHNRHAVIVDDMISTGSTLAQAAQVVQEAGAQSVTAVATHGLFTADAANILPTSGLTRILVTDSIERMAPLPSALATCVQVVSLGAWLGDWIAQSHTDWHQC